MNTKTSHILVVDDQDGIRESLIKDLQELGFENIESASNGKEAREKIEQRSNTSNAFSLVFCDLHMPVHNGLDLLKEIKSQLCHEKTNFIMLSGEHHSEVIIKTIELGAFDFLLKPYTSTQLKEKIEKVILV